MSNHRKNIWYEHYRPETLDDYIFQSSTDKVTFEAMVRERYITHILLSGMHGTGKSSLARIVARSVIDDRRDLLILNGSDENQIGVIRDKVKVFIQIAPIGEFKIVLIEEADRLSKPAQDSLKNLMEGRYAINARFIFTCNHDNRIIPELKSRFQQYHFQAPDRNDVTEIVAEVLLKEGIKFDLQTLDDYVGSVYPDVRKIISLTQQYSITGTLIPLPLNQNNIRYEEELLKLLNNSDWARARQLVCNETPDGEWEELFTFLYTRISDIEKFNDAQKWEAAIVTIAEYLYKHNFCADPEINIASMFIELSRI